MPRRTDRNIATPLVSLGAGRPAHIPDVLALADAPAPTPIRRLRPNRPAPPIETMVPRTSTVLGLDLSSNVTGWAIVAAGRLGDHGTFTLPTSARVREGRADYLLRKGDVLADILGLLVRAYRPDVVAYEYPDRPRNVWSGGSKGREFVVARALGQMEICFLVAARALGVTVIPVAVSAGKESVAGSAGASKARVRLSVYVWIGWVAPTTDVEHLKEKQIQDTLAEIHRSHSELGEIEDDEIDAASIALAVLARR